MLNPKGQGPHLNLWRCHEKKNIVRLLPWTLLAAAGVWLYTRRSRSYHAVHAELRSPLLWFPSPAFSRQWGRVVLEQTVQATRNVVCSRVA